MRIAHFCDSHAGRPDGVSRSAALTVALLRSAGHEVDFYDPASVPSVPLPGRQLRIGSPWFRCRPADLVHAHTTGPIGMTGFRMAAAWQVPLVVTWHTDLVAYGDAYPEVPAGASWCALQLRLGWSPREFLELTRPGPPRRARLVVLGQGMFARMTAAIAPSPKTAAGFHEFATAGRLPQVCVLPTPVVLRPRARSPRQGSVVLSVGRATAEKNPELLLSAFAQLLPDKPDARLILLGVRLGRAKLARRISALGLTDHVEVLPPVPPAQVAAFYDRADVLAFASTTDTQSLVLAEAEASGLPAVVADPALADRPGGAPPRFTCDPAPSTFAAALHRMLTDAALRATVTADGMKATEAYTPDVYLVRLVDLYQRL
ncbi:glycosyltransferase [Paractinoplanes lichenicola]|uniref:Glycosyltransferase n=1 Tax=Paractinoplanes lichenicola TaxID=2802976 RepID=A0ABS1VT68_9ACTN|nr:glycosyltransferase [Actinoplanes lichenicola]MBL7257660.1 glycosyltransferase [Actinoplanes lichenicola]